MVDAVYFSEESHRLCLSIIRQFLHRFHESVSLLLSKTNARPFVKFPLSHKILNRTDCSTLVCLLSSFFPRCLFFWEMLWCIRAVLLLTLCNLLVGSDVFNLKKLVQILAIFEKVWNLFKSIESIVWVMKDHYLKDSIEMSLDWIAVIINWVSQNTFQVAKVDLSWF